MKRSDLQSATFARIKRMSTHDGGEVGGECVVPDPRGRKHPVPDDHRGKLDL